MFCPKCGKPIPEGELSCPDCSTGFQKMMNKSPYGKLAKASSNAMEKIVNAPFKKNENSNPALSQPVQPKQIEQAPQQLSPAPVQPTSEQSNPAPVAQPNPAKGFAISGFIFSFIWGLVGLILSAIGLIKYKKQENKKLKGLAIAGLILSILKMIYKTVRRAITFIILLVVIIVGVTGGNTVSNDIYIYNEYDRDVTVTAFVSDDSYYYEKAFEYYENDYGYYDIENVEFKLDSSNVYDYQYLQIQITNNDYVNIDIRCYFDDYNLSSGSVSAVDWSHSGSYNYYYYDLKPGESTFIVFTLEYDVEFALDNSFELEVQIN